MNLPEHLQDALRKMTYATQFSRPMIKGVERTMDAIVWPFLYKFAPEQYLVEISLLLESNFKLSEDVFTNGRAEDEVRSYLKELAAAIENEFPKVARGGSVVKLAGTWKCVNCDQDVEVNLEVGNLLPSRDTSKAIWKFCPSHIPRSAMEAFTEELCTFYTKKTLRNSFPILDPEEYAIETSNRLITLLPEGQRHALIGILLQLKSNPKDPLFNVLKQRSGVNWPDHKDSWKFFEQFCSNLEAQLSESLK